MNKPLSINVHLEQPKGTGVHVITNSLCLREGEKLSMEEIMKKAGKKCFMIRFLGKSFSRDVLLPIGYDEPEFHSLEEFKVKAINRPEKRDIGAVTGALINDLKRAKAEGFTTVFTSLCTYSFTKSRYVIEKDNIVSIGLDANGNVCLFTDKDEEKVLFTVGQQIHATA